jgi:hypothetical protein
MTTIDESQLYISGKQLEERYAIYLIATGRVTSVPASLHRQLQHQRAAEGRGGHPGQLLLHAAIGRHDIVKFLEGNSHRDPGDRGAQAGVHATAEAEMAARLASDIVDVGIGELALVAIG